MKSEAVSMKLLLELALILACVGRISLNGQDQFSTSLMLIDCNDLDLDKYCNCAFDVQSNRSYMICPNMLDESVNKMPQFSKLESVVVINAFSVWPTIPSAYQVTSELDLSHNDLYGQIGDMSSMLSKEKNDTNDHLLSLNLSYNKLDKLNSQICRFRMLTVLDLSFNNFETIDFNDFMCKVEENIQTYAVFSSSLKEIFLNNNKIYHVNGLDLALFSMPHMSTLDLSYNNLYALKQECFSPKLLFNLNFIIERANTTSAEKAIMHAINNSFTSFYSIRITNNDIKHINLNLKPLVSFLGANNLTWLTRLLVKRVLVDLTNSHINCDCNLSSDLVEIWNAFKNDNESSTKRSITNTLERFFILFDQYSICTKTISQSLSKQYYFYNLLFNHDDMCSTPSPPESKATQLSSSKLRERKQKTSTRAHSSIQKPRLPRPSEDRRSASHIKPLYVCQFESPEDSLELDDSYYLNLNYKNEIKSLVSSLNKKSGSVQLYDKDLMSEHDPLSDGAFYPNGPGNVSKLVNFVDNSYSSTSGTLGLSGTTSVSRFSIKFLLFVTVLGIIKELTIF